MTDMENQVLNYSDGEEKQSQTTTKGRKRTGRRAQKKKTDKNVKKANTTHASTFKDFHLKEELLRATGEAGFENPSEVQCEGIPYITFGEDLLCQAKSGMGKTAVFVLGVLHSIQVPGDPFQAIVLCHTRELAH